MKPTRISAAPALARGRRFRPPLHTKMLAHSLEGGAYAAILSETLAMDDMDISKVRVWRQPIGAVPTSTPQRGRAHVTAILYQEGGAIFLLYKEVRRAAGQARRAAGQACGRGPRCFLLSTSTAHQGCPPSAEISNEITAHVAPGAPPRLPYRRCATCLASLPPVA